ncbi:MATE efflux family protein [Legionella steigerwaltii]|uniref:MATE efflux family protein n=1 Tax=Legionella steigerwaltii TaxID=460 RepID=A0A378L7F1_9GAMM|nr:MATE family efflux transporter [Legionella steigerwaltii]KTD69909.1 MATE efflux family protein [Legionella steigerwaltii]STY21778.1 MATE efflux family protein [Legionella steigerwaltii]
MQKKVESKYEKIQPRSINSTSQDAQNNEIAIKISEAFAASDALDQLDNIPLKNDEPEQRTPINDSNDIDDNSYGLWSIFNSFGLFNASEDIDDNSYGFWRVFKSLSSLSLPMALSFTFSFEIFLIVLLLNTLSENEDEVAAATLISTMINTLLVIGMAPLFSMSVVASNKIGELTEAEKNGETNEVVLQEKREYIAGISRNGLWLSTFLTPPIMAGMIFSKPLLTNLFGQNDHVAELTQNALRIYSPAVAGVLTRISTEQMMFSFGRSTPAMLMGLASLAVGTGISAWLGFGGLGIPKMGSAGIIGGYVFEAYLTSLLYALYLAKHKDFSQYEFFKIFKKFSGQFAQLKELLQIGGSITLSVASEMAMSLSVSILSGALGTKEQAAITNLNQYIFFNFLLLAGFGQGNSQEINRLIGAKRYVSASNMGKYGLLTTLIYTTPVPLFFAVMPGVLVMGNNSNQIKDILKYLAPIMSTGVILDSARYNLLQQLRVLGDLKGSTIISVSALSLGITGSALLGLKTKLGIYGVAAGYTGGVIIALPGLTYRWRNRINSDRIQEIAEETPQIDEEAPQIVKEPPRALTSSANCLEGFFSRLLKMKYKDEKENLLEHKGKTYNTTDKVTVFA